MSDSHVIISVFVALVLVTGCALLYYHQKNRLSNNQLVTGKKQYEEKTAFDEKYSMREISIADHSDIKTMCAEVYCGNDYFPKYLIQYIRDPHCVLYGCVDKQDRVIASAAVQCDVDGGCTGVLKGVRVHPRHRRRGIAFRLIQFTMERATEKFQSMKRLRSTQHRANAVSMRLHDKLGFAIRELTYPFQSTRWGKQHFLTFEQRMEQIRRENANNDEFKRYLNNLEKLKVTDLGKVMVMMTEHFKQKEAFIQYDIYDLNIDQQRDEVLLSQNSNNSTMGRIAKYFTSNLCQRMNAESLNIYTIDPRTGVDEDAVLCFECVGQVTYYHIYGITETAILCMILQMLTLWRKTITGDTKIEFFVTSDMRQSSAKLKWLFPDIDRALVRQKDLDFNV